MEENLHPHKPFSFAFLMHEDVMHLNEMTYSMKRHKDKTCILHPLTSLERDMVVNLFCNGSSSLSYTLAKREKKTRRICIIASKDESVKHIQNFVL